jgi:hypothetical protein
MVKKIYKNSKFYDFRDKLSDAFQADNLFLQWYASYLALGEADYYDRPSDKGLSADIYMSSRASMRFSIGIDDNDSSIVFGIAHDIVENMLSLNWNLIAFLKQVKGYQKGKLVIQDWVALSCPDIRAENSGSPEPIALRIWFPTTTGILDGWSGLPKEQYANAIRLFSTNFKNGVPIADEKELKSIPLVFKGKWDMPSKIRKQTLIADKSLASNTDDKK